MLRQRIRALVVLAAAMMPAAAQSANPYQVVQSVATAHGALQVLEDKRLSHALERLLWSNCVDILDVLDNNDPRAKPFIAAPLIPAKLRQVDEHGHIIKEIVLEEQAPVAKIETRQLGAVSNPIFQIRADDNACLGSYSGQAIWLFQFDHGGLSPVVATDQRGTSKQIILAETSKSTWRLVRAMPTDIEIEQMLCRPDFDAKKEKNSETPFLLRYITYRFDGSHWRMAERQERGFWEDDDGFPKRSKFPVVMVQPH